MSTATKSRQEYRPTRITVELRNGRARACTLEQGHFLGGRIMQINGNHIRLAVVGIHMPLLGGDSVEVQVQVGKGVTLEVIEPSGMVAYDAEGEYSRWSLDIRVEAGATLIWHGKEFVAAKGSNAHRSTNIKLEPDARVLLKETLVLGRSGESGAQLNCKTKASLDEQELLVEELALTPETRQLPGISGSSKVISTVTALGMRPSNEITGTQRLDLAGPGAVWRSMAIAAHSAEKSAEPVFRSWNSEILKRVNSDKAGVPADTQLQVSSSI